MSEDARLEALCARVRGDLECPEPTIVPDLRDTLARAHALDPGRVPESWLEQARTLAPVLPLRAPGPPARPDARLDAFLVDVRADLDEHVQERRARPIPAPPARRRGGLARLAPVAAVLVLAVAATAIAALGLGTRATDAEPGSSAAVHTAAPHPMQRASASAPPAAREPTGATISPTDTPAGATGPSDVSPDPGVPGAVERGAALARDKPSLADRVAELDALAQQQWRAGDLVAAQRSFEKIVKIARRGEYVELAYGDLFALARQLGDETRETELFRAYLGTFPHGRHAQDARSGLCRRAEAGVRQECWRAYLRDFPRGTHAASARRELGEP